MSNTIPPSPSEPAGASPLVPAEWKAIVARFQKPSALRASWQLLNTVGGYAVLWVLMYFTLPISWWLTAPLALLAGGLLVRVFIIFHDCGHGSFFKSNLANNAWGFLTGMLTFTPYYHWKWEHSRHHATAGNLDRRGVGDIWTLTVEEYLQASRWKRFSYRLARNPVILFLVAPVFVFVVRQRFTLPVAKPREKLSVYVMNAAVVGLSAGLISLYGWLPWLIIQAIVISVAASVGVWLFYVQHQFEDAYWERTEDWNYTEAAIKGSSFYKLPKVLQWFTGNIGYHHIHHLSARIPNYHLERCHRSHDRFATIEPLTFWKSLRCINFRLWDEESKKLISFGQLKRQLARA